jgi:hypothetical protein
VNTVLHRFFVAQERTIDTTLEGFLTTMLPPHEATFDNMMEPGSYENANCGGKCPGNCIAYVGCKMDPRDPRKTH